MSNSRSVLQLYYSDHAFTDSLGTICQDVIAALPDDKNLDPNYNSLFNYLQDYWTTDHNVAMSLTVPASIISDRPLNDIALFFNYIPLVLILDKEKPKASGSKISFIDRINTDWSDPRVRIALRTAVDIIYAVFATLVLKNVKGELTEDESGNIMRQFENYLIFEQQDIDSGKFRIISARYFAKALGYVAKHQPTFIIQNFLQTLSGNIKSLKKNTESDQLYLLNVTLCLYSEINTTQNFSLDKKVVDDIMSGLFSVISKKSRYDQTLQKDACQCILNFFGVVLSLKPELRESSLMSNMLKRVKSHSKNYNVFFCLEALLYVFDLGKHTSNDVKIKFLNKLIENKTSQGDVLNAFTFFLRGANYESPPVLNETCSNYTWTPDKSINDDMKEKIFKYVFSDPTFFEPYQNELSDFLIQISSFNPKSFIMNYLCKLVDITYFKSNAMAVLRLGKVLLLPGTKFPISSELRNIVNQLFNDAVYSIMQNALDSGSSGAAFHVASFLPIYKSHDSDFNKSIQAVSQCINPFSFRSVSDLIAPRTIKSKWCPFVSSSKTNILDPIESQIQIYNGVSTTDLMLIRVMTIIPIFEINEILITRVVTLIYSSLSDVSAFSIRLIQAFYVKYGNKSKIFSIIVKQISKSISLTNENLYMLLYTIHELLEITIDMRMTLDSSIIHDLNFAVIIGLCVQNTCVHDIALNVISQLHSLFPSNSIESILNKNSDFISNYAKRSALLVAAEIENFDDIINISFREIARTNLFRLHQFYIAAFAKVLSKELVDHIYLFKKFVEALQSFNPTRCDSYLFSTTLVFLTNSIKKEEKYTGLLASKPLDLIKDSRIEEWTGFPMFCALDDSIRFEWFSSVSSNMSIVEAISLGIRMSITSRTDEEDAKKYIECLSKIVKIFKKNKLIHTKLTFSFSSTQFMQYATVVRIVLDTSAALFKIFYEKNKKVPVGPYMRHEVMLKNVSDYFDIEMWYCFILNFISHKSKSSSSSSRDSLSSQQSDIEENEESNDDSKKKTKKEKKKENNKKSKKRKESKDNSSSSRGGGGVVNTARYSALNALCSLLSIVVPPESLYKKFIKNLSKYDDSSLSLVLSHYTEQLLPTFVSKALTSSTRYFHAIVNQFSSVQKNYLNIWMSHLSGEMTPTDIRFSDSIFTHTGTIIALAFNRIVHKSDSARSQAFALMLNVSVGAAAYLNKPESASRICEKMTSSMFTITSQLTNLYMSALLSISNILSQELSMFSEQFIETILDCLASGGNSALLASILAPWIKAPKFDDDQPIVFTATQPQFACFSRFSFAKSFSRITLTSSLSFVIDALLTTNGAASFLTVALFCLFQSNPTEYSNVSSTLSYIISQRPIECVPLISSIFEFAAWFYYNVELKSDSQQQQQEEINNNEKGMNTSNSQQVIQDMPKHRASMITQRCRSDPNLSQTAAGQCFIDPNITEYDKAIVFAIEAIKGTNLDIYKGYQHRLFSHALITYMPGKDDSLLRFLFPNQTGDEGFGENIAKELQKQGDDFVHEFGRECLIWGMCCSELSYAIQALILYRKILTPINKSIILKLTECLKLASIANNEKSSENGSKDILISYASNCLETIRIIAEKMNYRNIELYDLCVDFCLVKDPDLQCVSFNFMSFMLQDTEFVEKIRSTGRMNFFKELKGSFDSESCSAFFSLLLNIANVDLFEIVGSPVFTAVLILLMLPIINPKELDLSFFSFIAPRFDDFEIINKIIELTFITDPNDEVIYISALKFAKYLKDDELQSISILLSFLLKGFLTVSGGHKSSTTNTASIYNFATQLILDGRLVSAFAPIVEVGGEESIGNQILKNSLKEIFEKNKGIIPEKKEVDTIICLPNYVPNINSTGSNNKNSNSNKNSQGNINNNNNDSNCHINYDNKGGKINCNVFTITTDFQSSNDFSDIQTLPPIYFKGLSNCPTNNMVLQSIGRVRAQPLNEWSDLMFKAESTTAQVNAIKAKKPNQQNIFNGGRFLTSLRKIVLALNIQSNKNSYESTSLSAAITSEKDEKRVSIGLAAFTTDPDEIDEVWKETLEESGKKDLFYSVMI